MKPTGDGRDETFDRLLGREFSRPAAAPDACPQAELLSAWFDRALPATEAAAVEAHLANCARCQEVLAHLTRTEPEVLYVHPKPAPTPWTWHLRWAMPVAAAAVIVFVVGTRSLIAPDTGLPPQGVPVAPVEQTAQNSDRALTPPAEEKSPAGGLPVGTVPSGSSAPPAAADTVAKHKAQAEERRLGAPGGSGNLAAARGGGGNVPAAPVPSGNVAAPPAAIVEERLARQNAEPSSAAPARLQSRPSMVVSKDMPTPAGADAAPLRPQPSKVVSTQLPAPAGAAGEFRKVEAAHADSALSLDGRVELSAFVPGSPVGWRYVRPGQVLRTVDGGTRWTEQALPTPGRLLALSAASPSVCWAAGAAGTVVRTIDGATWQAIKSPTTADLVSIAALDDHRVTVRTADGASYDTGDAGATWRRR